VVRNESLLTSKISRGQLMRAERRGWDGPPRGSSLRAGASKRPCVRFETFSRARIISGRSARAPMEDVFAPVDCIGVRDVRGKGCGATAAGARSCAGVYGSAGIASMQVTSAKACERGARDGELVGRGDGDRGKNTGVVTRAQSDHGRVKTARAGKLRTPLFFRLDHPWRSSFARRAMLSVRATHVCYVHCWDFSTSRQH
jgi:hypothetical protein